MPTENILLKFTSDLSGLKSASDELVKMGKLTEEDKKKFDTLLGTIEGIDDALKEAGVEASKFSKEVAKGADSGKSLRTQLADAKNEAVRLSQAFGPFSKEAREAAKRAAAIKDEIADLNDTLDALNPEAKLNAFVKLGQGVQGAFQVATGALQVFGVENERITKLAQQFQGVLNVTQGINSVLQLKDVYGQLRLVLGVTTTAQKGLAAATAADAVATNSATVATKGFTAALAANPITAVAVALAALVAGIIIYNATAEEANELTQEQIDLNNELAKSYQELGKTISDQITDQRIKTALAAGDIDELTAKLQQNEIARARAIEDLSEKYAKLNEELKKNNEEARFFVTDQDIAEINKLFNLREKEIKLLDEKAKKEKEGKKITKDAEKTTVELLTKLGIANRDLLNTTDEEFQNLKDFLNLLEADAYKVRDAILAINRELSNLAPISVDIKTTATDLNEALFKREDELTEKIKEENEKRREDSIDMFNMVATGSLNVAQSITDLNNQLYANDFANLQQMREDGFLTEKQYADRVKALKIKQFEENKKLSLAQATIAAAQAIVNALTIVPASAAATAVFFASTLSALNIAKILSTEPPSFKKGTLNFQGGNVDADGGRLAVLHPREAVIPADRNADYHPTIKAVFNRQIKASEINGFVEARLKGKIPNSIDAKIDHRKLGQMLKGNNAVELTNAKMVGKVIAKELSKTMDIRRQ